MGENYEHEVRVVLCHYRALEEGYLTSREFEREMQMFVIDELIGRDEPDSVRSYSDDVEASWQYGPFYISAVFPIATDHWDGSAYISTGGASCEYAPEPDEGHFVHPREDYFLLTEDMEMSEEFLGRSRPNVDKQRRDAAKERRDREAEFRRMVL